MDSGQLRELHIYSRLDAIRQTHPLSPGKTGDSKPKLSVLLRVTVIHVPSQPGFPTLDAGDKKFNSRLVVPILLRKIERRIERGACRSFR
jgi:hypothetical protein